MTIQTYAQVATDRPDRYGKQLVSHLGRRHGGTWNDETGRGEIELASGRAHLACAVGELRVAIDCSAEDVARLEDVVGRHLVRFATRDTLDVAWRRLDGGTGSRQTSDAASRPD